MGLSFRQPSITSYSDSITTTSDVIFPNYRDCRESYPDSILHCLESF